MLRRRGLQVNELAKMVQPGIVAHHISYRHVFFSVLTELGPVLADSVGVFESAVFVHFRDQQRREVLARAEDIRQRVCVERSIGDFALRDAFAFGLTENVDDFVASVIDAELGADIEASEEERLEDILDGLEVGMNVSLNPDDPLSKDSLHE